MPTRAGRFLNVCLFYTQDKTRMRFMIDAAHTAGLRVSYLVSASTLRVPAAVTELCELKAQFKDEIVLWLDPDHQMVTEAGIKDKITFFVYCSRLIANNPG